MTPVNTPVRCIKTTKTVYRMPKITIKQFCVGNLNAKVWCLWWRWWQNHHDIQCLYACACACKFSGKYLHWNGRGQTHTPTLKHIRKKTMCSHILGTKFPLPVTLNITNDPAWDSVLILYITYTSNSTTWYHDHHHHHHTTTKRKTNGPAFCVRKRSLLIKQFIGIGKTSVKHLNTHTKRKREREKKPKEVIWKWTENSLVRILWNGNVQDSFVYFHGRRFLLLFFNHRTVHVQCISSLFFFFCCCCFSTRTWFCNVEFYCCCIKSLVWMAKGIV